MVTRSVSERERAMPQTSKPGPTFAVVAGTWILYLRVVIPDLRKRSVSTFAHQQLATRRDMVRYTQHGLLALRLLLNGL